MTPEKEEMMRFKTDKRDVENWSYPSANHKELVADALRRIADEKNANKPAVTLFACNAAALVHEIARLRAESENCPRCGPHCDLLPGRTP
jgi:hypothetical protein